ncbi:TspO/MBR family protein [Candidatus Chloroploca asiatica]|uniref:Tryptophan-rich sensory protein n=1 Tax=Candidatus Chloroploca asiatica TaxID=1506545 RepID=A0A2H3L3V3_9CHLR|nr:TspO/MBR family protein [Candidatus Chloroploca asiatica]PDW01433.1 hypothetical protein A9Q02_20865 [Candidatus Chloroploca asiatica]
MTNAATAGAQPTYVHLTRQGAVLAALAGTLTVNVLANTLPINGQTTGEISDKFPILITPPGYVFGIWGVIYTGLLSYAVYQALPSNRDKERLKRIAWPFILSCAANASWIVLWHYNQLGISLGVIIGLLLALITIDRRLGKATEMPLADRLLVRLPFSIYLGWASVATIVNAAVVLYDAEWNGMGLSPEVWTAGTLGVGAGLGAAMGVREQDVAFPLVLAWAFSGIARKQAETPLVGPAAWVATAVALLSAGAALWLRRRR